MAAKVATSNHGFKLVLFMSEPRVIEKLSTRETIEILRTFAESVLATGLLERGELEAALDLLEDIVREPKHARHEKAP